MVVLAVLHGDVNIQLPRGCGFTEFTTRLRAPARSLQLARAGAVLGAGRHVSGAGAAEAPGS